MDLTGTGGGNTSKKDTGKKGSYEIGKQYWKNGEQYTFLGYDDNGAENWEGFSRNLKMKPVKLAPRFDSNSRKLSKRKYGKKIK